MVASNDLNISEAGYVVFDGVSTFSGRTFVAGTGITLGFASGVAGNTTISASGLVGQTITGDSGGALPPSSGNWNHLGAANQITTTGAGSTLTFSIPAVFVAPGSIESTGILKTDSGQIVKVTTPGAYPYTTLTSDFFIKVDTSVARTINLVGSPATGTFYVIKDTVGSAATNNITITPAAGNIDGAASFTINTNYGSINLVYTGSEWSVC